MSAAPDRPVASPPGRRVESLLAAAATAAVGALLLVPLPFEGTGPAPFGLPHADKLVHGALFLVLSVLWLRAVDARPRGRRTVVLIAALALYGGLLELLQGATGARTAEWGDFAADLVGAALAPLALRWASTPRSPAVPAAVPVAAEAQADSGEVASR